LRKRGGGGIDVGKTELHLYYPSIAFGKANKVHNTSTNLEMISDRRKSMVESQIRKVPEPVTLREITRENIKAILALKVSERQKKVYPRSNGYSIAEGHYPPDDNPVWMRAIYAGEQPVGFLMTSEAPEDGEFAIWRIMVDENHQGKGYGSQAIGLLIKRIEAFPKASTLYTSHMKGDGNAGPFYQRLGFKYTGEVLGGYDYQMKIDFTR
jgi:diamine N-acetyltransferase